MSEVIGCVLTIQVGMPAGRDAESDPWFTGIFKSPIAGPVSVTKRNLAGDAQADLRVHGGPNKAVMAYSAENYPLWRAELGLSEEQFPFGAFGENLTIRGLHEESVCIGDVHRIGSATLQVSQPRSPCWKLARKWMMPDLPKRFVLTKRSGWYYRVLEEGALEGGDEVRLIERKHADWPIRRITDITYNFSRASGELVEMEQLEELASQWKEL
jgi:MOSC domain-containing protein YiiM